MKNEKIRMALFKEIHNAISESAESVINQFQNSDISYPPGVELNDEEKEALSKIEMSGALETGLKKLITDAAAYPMFHFFSLLDGVTDPAEEIDIEWFGATIVEKMEDDNTMLHDELYETYE